MNSVIHCEFLSRASFIGAWLFLTWLVPGVPAQEAATRISASAKDAVFRVDGQSFAGTAIFTWPAGSKHSLDIANQQDAPSLIRTRYAFQHWSTSAGTLASPSNYVTITADPGVAWYNADLSVEYAVSLRFFQCAEVGCTSPGTIWINQAAYQQDADVWLGAGSTVKLEAVPNAGNVFAGWSQGDGTLPPVYSFVLNAATLVYPRFAPARSVQLLTEPEGLQLLADRGLVTTPVTLEWGWNTAHTLGVVSPQQDRMGRQWVFHSWSDGGTLNHTYQVPATSSAIVVTAQFVPAVPVALVTNPPGLSLTIDGRDGPSPRYFSWAAGESHAVTAPLRQTDSKGAPYQFREWSNGLGSSQTIQVTDGLPEAGIRLTAWYDPRSRIRVTSTPGSLAIRVDGKECLTPCEIERAVGASVNVTAPASIAVAEGSRLDLESWEGGTPGTLTAEAGFRTITVHYHLAYRLTLGSEPDGAGSWQISPLGTDGFYPAGSLVSIGFVPFSGMQFRTWALDLSGTANPASLLLDRPRAVRAMVDALPKTEAPRVANAAGETPAAGVAAGSIASLFGAGLSDSTAGSQTNPLPQSLGGVTLECSGHLLPMFYVSPQQINFQVPSDLEPGTYRLKLHRQSGPAVQVDLVIVPDAPGLFLAAHEDESPITEYAPAHPGELVILYGTGFGRYDPMPLDGFQVPATVLSSVVDPVIVRLGDRTIAPDAAIAATGSVGVTRIVFRVPKDVDTAVPLQVSVLAAGVSSNVLTAFVN